MTFETCNLSITRDGVPVLEGIDLSLPPGGITAIIGPNGAGKSTLLHAMAGLLSPHAGAVRLNGRDLSGIQPGERARSLALLTQDQGVTARLTVADLIAFGRWPHHQGRPGHEDRAAVADAIETFDLGPLAARTLDALSGGQRQRAFVAMAYAQTTPWILLDEPLSALDPRYAHDIMRRLHDLSRTGPDARSVVIVVHDLGVTARFADRVIGLKDGKLFGAGETGDLMTSDWLTRLYDTPMEVAEVGGRKIPFAA
ncbi:ATP-binding cassette domain-containing protein [Palleronia abyssalis]|uniref:Fe(3+) dicitrate transport ATP-binding protein FecE n=1 Tax=Palleronia abyssalis TaxID=1501240 RepID=A0A2R8BYT5_9RHOB|nr:ABC transporter ATP-binding protein [Palleronia abyssalis]SPJ25299.1 Fe(3+) dicitrate transport ATP-binding protein FecE [Palleronia abyssalis]